MLKTMEKIIKILMSLIILNIIGPTEMASIMPSNNPFNNGASMIAILV